MVHPPEYDAVLQLMRDVATAELLPRFGRLQHGEVELKAPDEVVTAADRATEHALTAQLQAWLPQSRVVGEEAAHERPELVDDLASQAWVWLVDPLDGTKHFAAGQPTFGIMIALLHHGCVHGAWIYEPMRERWAYGGQELQHVLLNGSPCRVPTPPPLGLARGALLTKFLPPPYRATAEAASGLRRTDGEHHSAAVRSLNLLEGSEHYALYYRTLPWDHAAGAFLVEKAGGIARRLDGSRYEAADGRAGLLVAASSTLWKRVHAHVVPGMVLEEEPTTSETD